MIQIIISYYANIGGKGRIFNNCSQTIKFENGILNLHLEELLALQRNPVLYVIMAVTAFALNINVTGIP